MSSHLNPLPSRRDTVCVSRGLRGDYRERSVTVCMGKDSSVDRSGDSGL